MTQLITKLYKEMYRIRKFEDRIALKYHEGKMRCPTHLSIGQEAVAAAYSLCIKKNDFAVSTHRGHAHYLAKGGNMNALIAEIYGKETGCSKGKGGSMHLIDLDVNFMGSSAIVGNSIPLGVGLGLSSQLKKTKQVSTVFMGEGATEEGVFYESLNFAIIKKLPILFICENNLYSVYSNLQVRQPTNRKIYNMVKSIGAGSAYCNGFNPLQSYKILKKTIDLIRSGSGPQFIEFYTYRFKEHCGPNDDDDLNYRSKKELNYWKKNDPIEKYKNKLNKNKLLLIENSVNKEIDSAFSFAEKSKFPKQKEAYKGLYAQ